MQAVSSLFNFLWRENYRVPLKDAGKLAQSPHWYEGGGGGMTSCILSMWKVLLVTNLRLVCHFVSCRPTVVTMITLLTTFAFNSRFETLDVDNIRIWIFPLLWILNMLKYHNVIHISSLKPLKPVPWYKWETNEHTMLMNIKFILITLSTLWPSCLSCNKEKSNIQFYNLHHIHQTYHLQHTETTGFQNENPAYRKLKDCKCQKQPVWLKQ